MEARQHYARALLLQLQQGPAASPAPAPATAAAVPDAPAADASTFLSEHAALILAVLFAALALRVVQGALRATRRACHDDDGADDDAAHPQDYPEHATGGGAAQPAPRHGGKLLVQAPPCLAYTAALELELAGSSRSECAICLAAFARGDAVRVLPRCSHGFHARCIDRWLAARPTCPTCRQAPFAKATALLQPGNGSGAPAVVPLVRVAIVGDRVARPRLVEP